MGTPRSDFPDFPDAPSTSVSRPGPFGPPYVPKLGSPPVRKERRWLHVLLFLLTVFTTSYVGGLHYLSFESGFGGAVFPSAFGSFLADGLWYSVSILAILGTHEFGHYYACRYYKVDASLPYFLPAPLPLTGTLGAFIRIRQQIPGKRELFDIGIAGPIAGFLVAIPVLLLGMMLSRVDVLPPDAGDNLLELGEPLLFKAVAWLTFGPIPDGSSINLHPMAFGAWFGLLATALNLFPIGQLDGGHISYAVLGRGSTLVTLATVVCLIGLSFVSSSWVVWTVLTVMMLLAFGPRHPRTFDEEVPLDRTRVYLAIFAAIMFVLCFTPAPIQPFQLLGR
jgi:membrane-associated protease RseP (regulator of RpoE activity)